MAVRRVFTLKNPNKDFSKKLGRGTNLAYNSVLKGLLVLFSSRKERKRKPNKL